MMPFSNKWMLAICAACAWLAAKYRRSRFGVKYRTYIIDRGEEGFGYEFVQAPYLPRSIKTPRDLLRWENKLQAEFSDKY